MTTTARTYTVGLPVAITVDDEGRVSYWVDTSEAGSAVLEDGLSDDRSFDQAESDGADGTQRTLLADVASIEADHERRRTVTMAQPEPRWGLDVIDPTSPLSANVQARLLAARALFVPEQV